MSDEETKQELEPATLDDVVQFMADGLMSAAFWLRRFQAGEITICGRPVEQDETP